MKARFISFLSLAVTALYCGYGVMHASEGSAVGEPKFLDPHAIVATYLKAVDRGELIVFDHRLDRSMVAPRRVEYVFELDSRIPTVKVYSELLQPMAVPNDENCEVRAVSALLNADGKIVETEAHVWQKQQTKPGVETKRRVEPDGATTAVSQTARWSAKTPAAITMRPLLLPGSLPRGGCS
jgi:hypothetical protein